MRLFAAICAVLLIPALTLCQSAVPASATSPNKEAAVVAGQVLRLDTGEPLKKAQVSLQSHTGDSYSAFRLTDEQGHFSIENVPPGPYRLEVSRNGFVDNEYGQKKSGASGAVLTLSAGQRMTDLVFKMTRTASISGHVFDEDGEPLPYAQVTCYRASRQPGKEEPSNYQPVTTNDLGEFRVFDLTPSRYYVAVNFRLKRSFDVGGRNAEREFESGYPATFFPNTTDPSKAAAISVSAGDEIRSIDLLLRPAHFVTVSGRVISTVVASQPAYGSVDLSSHASGLSGAAEKLNDSFEVKDGHFVIHNVPPGSYTLSASFMDRESREWHMARRQLDVGTSDVQDVLVTINPGVAVTGRIVWEGAPAGDVQDLMVWLRPVDENSMSYQPQSPKADGSFALKSISEGIYRPRVTPRGHESSFYLKAARYGPTSIPESGFAIQAGVDLPLEITLSSRAAQLSGVVLTADSLPASGVTVVLIPDVARRAFKDFYKTATTDQNGKFSIKGVAPGDYKLYSWESVEGNEWSDAEWYDAAWLKPYETKGEWIHFEESDNKSVNLALIESKPDSTPAN